MLSGIVAQTGVTTYDLEPSDRLIVPADYRGDLTVNATGWTQITIDQNAIVEDIVVNAVDSPLAGSGDKIITYFGFNSTADSLTINGLDNMEQVILADGAFVGRAEFNGDGGNDFMRINRGATVGTLAFVTGTGNDRLDVLGTITGDLTLGTGSGGDSINFRRGSVVGGSVLGTTGAGADRVTAVGTSLGSVDIAFEQGTDLFFATPTTTIDGDQILDLGAGNDRVWMGRSGITITGDQTIFAGSGADQVTVLGVTVGGDQTIDLGIASGGRDRATFGSDRIEGSSTISWLGATTITETGVRVVEGAYQLLGGGSQATLNLRGGSQVNGGMLIENFGRLDLDLLADVTDGGLSLRTGQFNDNIFIRGGSSFVGEVNLFSGGGNDRVQFVSGLTDITGDLVVNTGWGADSFLTDELFLDGTLLLNLGNAATDFDRAFFGSNIILGNSETRFLDGAIITETAAQDLRSDYIIQGDVSTLSFTANSGTTVLNNFTLRNAGRNRVTAPITVFGTARVIGGDRNDNFDLSGIQAQGVLDVSTDGAADIVRLTDAFIGGKASVLLGGGNDILNNDFTFFDSDSYLDGGAGIDELTDPGNGFSVNFEN